MLGLTTNQPWALHPAAALVVPLQWDVFITASGWAGSGSWHTPRIHGSHSAERGDRNVGQGADTAQNHQYGSLAGREGWDGESGDPTSAAQIRQAQSSAEVPLWMMSWDKWLRMAPALADTQFGTTVGPRMFAENPLLMRPHRFPLSSGHDFWSQRMPRGFQLCPVSLPVSLISPTTNPSTISLLSISGRCFKCEDARRK